MQLYTMAHNNALVFCRKIGDIGMFVYKIKLFVVLWIATAYDGQDVTICKQPYCVLRKVDKDMIKFSM